MKKKWKKNENRGKYPFLPYPVLQKNIFEHESDGEVPIVFSALGNRSAIQSL